MYYLFEGVNKVQKYTSDVQSFDPQDDQEKEISEALNEMIALSNSGMYKYIHIYTYFK